MTTGENLHIGKTETEPEKTEVEQALLAYIATQENRDALHFLTCGSVDDGKSTLIGRLLYDSKTIFEDQLAALEKDSLRHGTVEKGLDFALLVDGLEAEREQGITIDVAYRFFATDKRKFIVADTPGHEQYTRNMVTGASTADLAVLLVDARKGLLTQTRRHSYIVSLLGVRHVVLAVNKIDLVGYAQERFEEITAAYQEFARSLSFQTFQAIPLSALHGDNVTTSTAQMPWYQGPSLLAYLETIDINKQHKIGKPFRFPVQWVNRPHSDFRGFSGTIAAGHVRPGDRILVAASGHSSTVGRIVTQEGDLAEAVAGQAVTLTLSEEIDASRGDLFVAPESPPENVDQFAAHIIWMSEEALLPGRHYLLKAGTRWVSASVTQIRHKIDINSFTPLPARHLALNEIALCNLSTAHPLAFDPYEENRATGSFILVDRLTHATVGAGLIRHALRRATNLHWQTLQVNKQARAQIKGQKGAVVWFTGLSGAGKSTLASLLEKKLHLAGRHTYVLDGDNIRQGLNRDLGFTDEDRVENIRRVAEVARLMVDAGLITLVSFISPFRSERRMARTLMEPGEFLEIFVDTPLEECEKRDPKGLYKKVHAGQLQNFTGIDSAYEVPESPELHLSTIGCTAEALVDQILEELRRRGILYGASSVDSLESASL